MVGCRDYVPARLVERPKINLSPRVKSFSSSKFTTLQQLNLFHGRTPSHSHPLRLLCLDLLPPSPGDEERGCQDEAKPAATTGRLTLMSSKSSSPRGGVPGACVGAAVIGDPPSSSLPSPGGSVPESSPPSPPGEPRLPSRRRRCRHTPQQYLLAAYPWPSGPRPCLTPPFSRCTSRSRTVHPRSSQNSPSCPATRHQSDH